MTPFWAGIPYPFKMERMQYVSWETPLQYFEEGDLMDKTYLHFTSRTWRVLLWFWFSVFSLSSSHTHISKIVWSFFFVISCGRKMLRSVVPQVVPGTLRCSCHQWQTPLQNKILQQLMLSSLWDAVPGLGCSTCSGEEHESIALEGPRGRFQWQESRILPSIGRCLYWCVLPFVWWEEVQLMDAHSFCLPAALMVWWNVRLRSILYM